MEQLNIENNNKLEVIPRVKLQDASLVSYMGESHMSKRLIGNSLIEDLRNNQKNGQYVISYNFDKNNNSHGITRNIFIGWDDQTKRPVKKPNVQKNAGFLDKTPVRNKILEINKIISQEQQKENDAQLTQKPKYLKKGQQVSYVTHGRSCFCCQKKRQITLYSRTIDKNQQKSTFIPALTNNITKIKNNSGAKLKPVINPMEKTQRIYEEDKKQFKDLNKIDGQFLQNHDNRLKFNQFQVQKQKLIKLNGPHILNNIQRQSQYRKGRTIDHQVSQTKSNDIKEKESSNKRNKKDLGILKRKDEDKRSFHSNLNVEDRAGGKKQLKIDQLVWKSDLQQKQVKDKYIQNKNQIYCDYGADTLKLIEQLQKMESDENTEEINQRSKDSMITQRGKSEEEKQIKHKSLMDQTKIQIGLITCKYEKQIEQSLQKYTQKKVQQHNRQQMSKNKSNQHMEQKQSKSLSSKIDHKDQSSAILKQIRQIIKKKQENLNNKNHEKVENKQKQQGIKQAYKPIQRVNKLQSQSLKSENAKKEDRQQKQNSKIPENLKVQDRKIQEKNDGGNKNIKKEKEKKKVALQNEKDEKDKGKKKQKEMKAQEKQKRQLLQNQQNRLETGQNIVIKKHQGQEDKKSRTKIIEKPISNAIIQYVPEIQEKLMQQNENGGKKSKHEDKILEQNLNISRNDGNISIQDQVIQANSLKSGDKKEETSENMGLEKNKLNISSIKNKNDVISRSVRSIHNKSINKSGDQIKITKKQKQRVQEQRLTPEHQPAQQKLDRIQEKKSPRQLDIKSKQINMKIQNKKKYTSESKQSRIKKQKQAKLAIQKHNRIQNKVYNYELSQINKQEYDKLPKKQQKDISQLKLASNILSYHQNTHLNKQHPIEKQSSPANINNIQMNINKNNENINPNNDYSNNNNDNKKDNDRNERNDRNEKLDIKAQSKQKQRSQKEERKGIISKPIGSRDIKMKDKAVNQNIQQSIPIVAKPKIISPRNTSQIKQNIKRNQSSNRQNREESNTNLAQPNNNTQNNNRISLNQYADTDSQLQNIPNKFQNSQAPKQITCISKKSSLILGSNSNRDVSTVSVRQSSKQASRQITIKHYQNTGVQSGQDNLQLYKPIKKVDASVGNSHRKLEQNCIVTNNIQKNKSQDKKQGKQIIPQINQQTGKDDRKLKNDNINDNDEDTKIRQDLVSFGNISCSPKLQPMHKQSFLLADGQKLNQTDFPHTLQQKIKQRKLNKDNIKTRKENKSRSQHTRAPILSYIYGQERKLLQKQMNSFDKSAELCPFYFNQNNQQYEDQQYDAITKAVTIVLHTDPWLLDRIIQPYSTKLGYNQIWLYCQGHWKSFQSNNSISPSSFIRQSIYRAMMKQYKQYDCNKLGIQQIIRMLTGLRVMQLKNKKKLSQQLEYHIKKGNVIKGISVQGNKKMYSVTGMETTTQQHKLIKIQPNPSNNCLITDRSDGVLWIKQETFKKYFDYFLLICYREESYWTSKSINQHKNGDTMVYTLDCIKNSIGSLQIHSKQAIRCKIDMYRQIRPKVLKFIGEVNQKHNPERNIQNPNSNICFNFNIKGRYYLLIKVSQIEHKDNNMFISLQSNEEVDIKYLQSIQGTTLKNSNSEYIQIANRNKNERSTHKEREKQQSLKSQKKNVIKQNIREQFINYLIGKEQPSNI